MLNVTTDSKPSMFQTSHRRTAANAFLWKLVVDSASIPTLLDVLRATPAESAEDRADDLCAVYVRGVLSDMDVDRLIDRKTDAHIAAVLDVYGVAYTTPRVWKHSWSRRTERVGGERLVRPRETWLEENARLILRAGGAEVKAFGCPWVRIAADLPYAKMLEEHLAALRSE